MPKRKEPQINPQRVIERREARELSQDDLAVLVGMTQQGIQSIEAGASKRPRKLSEIAEALDTSMDYLLNLSDDATLTPPGGIPIKSGIPVLGEVAAGLWLEIDLPPHDPTEWLPFMPEMGWKPEATYAVRVRGNSVDKHAPDGSMLICTDVYKSGIEVKDGDLVIVERRREQEGKREVTVKRLRVRKRGFDLLPESSDPHWKPLFIPHDQREQAGEEEIRIIARVEWVATRPSSK